jgi:hypothetical protein
MDLKDTNFAEKQLLCSFPCASPPAKMGHN